MRLALRHRHTLVALLFAAVTVPSRTTGLLGAQGAPTSTPVPAAGFVVKHEVQVKAAPARTWEALLQVGRWWNPSHSWSGDAKNLTIDPRAGGCFCESLPGGGGVEHLRVVFFKPNELLRMAGALGPLQTMGATGHLAFQLTADGTGTRIAASYIVGGWSEGGLDKMGPLVGMVLREQVDRLARYIDTGSPTAPK